MITFYVRKIPWHLQCNRIEDDSADKSAWNFIHEKIVAKDKLTLNHNIQVLVPLGIIYPYDLLKYDDQYIINMNNVKISK